MTDRPAVVKRIALRCTCGGRLRGTNVPKFMVDLFTATHTGVKHRFLKPGERAPKAKDEVA
jgi:hypothetical protein